MVKKAEHSEQALYWLWHAYANLTGYPTGFIYLLSRISADLRDNNVDDVRRLSKSLHVLANYLDRKADDLAAVKAPDMDDRHANAGEQLTAYATIITYHRDALPADHPEAGTLYKHSKQRLKDARQVLILLKLMRHVPPPFEPAGNR